MIEHQLLKTISFWGAIINYTVFFKFCFCFFLIYQNIIYFKNLLRDFSGGPVVKTSPANAGGVALILAWAAKLQPALHPKHQSIKQQLDCNTFNKRLKNGPHKKKNLEKQFLSWPYIL